jgi:anti-sigma factor RsiW
MLVVEIGCRAVWKIVSEYVDGELDPELRERLEAHLSVCRHCTAIVDGLRNVVRLGAEGSVIQLPPGFSKRLIRWLELEGLQ